MQTKSFALLLLTVAAFSACEGCRKGNNVKASPGELAIVWKGENFANIVDRDAKYDFGYALVGESRQAVIVAKNVRSEERRVGKEWRSRR